MSAYSEEIVLEKLNKLNESQESIQTLSQWLMYHKKRAKDSVQLWAQQIQKVPTHKKLLFLYVANDVVQFNKKKGGEFVQEFMAVFPEAISHVFKHADENVKRSVVRLLDIWMERKVYSPMFVNEIKGRMGADVKGLSVSSARQKQQQPPPNLDLKIKKDTAKVAEQLKEIMDTVDILNMNIPKDLLLVEQIHAHPRDIFEGNYHSKFQGDPKSAENELKRVQEIGLELGQLEGRLLAEIHDRSNLLALLKKFVADQESILKVTQGQLEDCKKKIVHITETKKLLKVVAESPPQPHQTNADISFANRAPFGDSSMTDQPLSNYPYSSDPSLSQYANFPPDSYSEFYRWVEPPSTFDENQAQNSSEGLNV